MTQTIVMIWWLCLAANPQCEVKDGLGVGQLEQGETVSECEEEWTEMLEINPAPDGFVARQYV